MSTYTSVLAGSPDFVFLIAYSIQSFKISRCALCFQLLTQPKEGQQQLKNKKQPELTENRTVWKSDNQRDKEETFIQTGRRGGDGQPGGEGSPQGSGWQTQQDGRLWSGAGKAAAGQ